jgi:hypothetical protein
MSKPLLEFQAVFNMLYRHRFPRELGKAIIHPLTLVPPTNGGYLGEEEESDISRKMQKGVTCLSLLELR